MKRHFFAPGAIHVEHRRSCKAGILFKQAQRLSILPESGEETRVLLSSEPDHAQLRDHDGPTENRHDSQKSENHFPCDRRVIERKQQTATGR